MCGILCLVDSNKRYSPEVFRELTDTLAHRGPNAAGVLQDGPFYLGHRRLSILDLSSAANQPFQSACGRYQIVFNGEIYNYQELRQQWKIPTRTQSDTEVLLEGFARFGPEVASSLRGMFAFCIYDQVSKELFLFRDHVGIKPLFYHNSDGLFAAASELRPLLRLSEVSDAGFDQQALTSFLGLGYIPAPATAYRAVRKFPPGHWARWKDGELSFHRYWDALEQASQPALQDEEEAAELVHSRLNASVREQLVSDVPFGAFLSGGTDSSLVVALAQQHTRSPLRTFCVRMHGHAMDESGFARRVAERLGTEHFEFDFQEEEAVALIPEITAIYQEPFADSSAAPSLLLSRLARRHVTMALAGDGGDELFLGYGSYTWSRRLANPWLKPARPLLSSLLKKLGDRPQRLGELLEPIASPYQAHNTFSAEQGFFTAAGRRQLLQPDWLARQQPLLNPADALSSKSPEERQALFDLGFYLPDDLLTKVDRATMRYSLESRVPILCPRVIEAALRVPLRLKIQQGTHKYLLKKLLSRYLPDDLVHRRKWGFSIPLQRWMQGPLRWMEEEYLHPQVLARLGMVRPDVVGQLRQRFHRGEKRLYHRLWSLIVLHKWFLEN